MIAAVQARMDSKRLPGKALIDVCGRPSIFYPMERAGRSGFPVVLAATDAPEDGELAAWADGMGYTVHRGPEHVAQRLYEVCVNFNADCVVRVTGDDLMADPDLMVRAVQMHFKEAADYTTMPAVSRGWDSEVISRHALGLALKMAEPELLGLVLGRLPIRRLVTALSTPHKPPLELNTPADLERVRAYIARNGWEP